MASSMDTDSALKTLSRRAARYSLNLDGQVDLDKPKGAFHGKSALVYPGILRQNGVERHVAVKVFRSGPPGDLDMLKVMVLIQRSLLRVHSGLLLAHLAGGSLMVQAIPQEYCSNAWNLNGF